MAKFDVMMVGQEERENVLEEDDDETSTKQDLGTIQKACIE